MHKSTSVVTVSDVLHAVVIAGVLSVSAIGVSDELFSPSDDARLAMAVRVTTAASIALDTPLVQPSNSYFALKSS